MYNLLMLKNKLMIAAKAAFPYTLPILTGFLFLGMAYGIYMHVSGFSFLYPFFLSICIFAGSLEFLTVSILLSPFHPIQTLILVFMVQARHLFYGLAMLDRYKNVGKKRWYLIYALCDETFSINYSIQVPNDVDQGWFYFFISLFNQCYWVMGATLGGLFGNLITIDTSGLEFVLTAMFIVIYLEQWLKQKQHMSGYIGLACAFICLFVFGQQQFMIPTMLSILLCITLFQKQIDQAGDVQ